MAGIDQFTTQLSTALKLGLEDINSNPPKEARVKTPQKYNSKW